MSNPVSRYRAYLKRKSAPLDGLALVSEMRWQLIAWLIPPIAALSICKLLGTSLVVETWAMRLSLCLSAAGFALVAWEFFLSPLRDDFMDARERAKRHRA
ncbi:hypothetical protein KRR38_30535 [Novosphingobium sp. G106]|uniref:hypothetical protein n=1 Tax=Novosphingobium sp. G106 TaxID=2849500 RepID=UPI001C2D98AC|nr:hypothetical protein [Novosphingobium sp. G106]MBV1691887.1 hypothetical protein [Novosphingobium sp. G106]